MPDLRVLELFSGVGGMHRAAEVASEHLAATNLTVIGAVDINTVSNDIYKHNHPTTNHMQRNITGMTVSQVTKLSPDLVLMSPPCQPHTRQGKQLDTEDPRSSPLHHLMSVLPQVASIKYLLLENVCGFEKSKAREMVITSLKSAGFEIQEFLVCPRQIGIPNSRLRYYLLAKRGENVEWSFDESEEFINNFATLSKNLEDMNICTDSSARVADYLDIDKDVIEEVMVPEKVLAKRSKVLDIVRPDSLVSCCFTAGYTRYCEGTGSVLQAVGERGDMDRVYSKLDGEGVEVLSELKLRYFTPREVASLLGFPSDFSFPPTVTLRQQYKALGNSLNVTVVGLLIYSLVKRHDL